MRSSFIVGVSFAGSAAASSSTRDRQSACEPFPALGSALEGNSFAKFFFFSPLFSSRLRSAILRVLPIRKCADRLRFAASEREVCRAISSDPERMLIVRREQSAILEPGRFAKMARVVD